MTTTLHDLRLAWLPTILRAGNAAGEGEGEPAADPPPPADEGGAEGDQPDKPTEEELRNPRIKKLSDEAAKHRTNAKVEKDRADAAEARATKAEGALKTLGVRVAFAAAAAKANVADPEAAWKLAADDLRAVEVDENGEVDDTLVGDVVRHVVNRYPTLVETPPASGRPSGRKPDSGLDTVYLTKKYPALRHGGAG